MRWLLANSATCLLMHLCLLLVLLLLQPRHIAVAAWADAHMHELMRSFAEFAPVGSTVSVISTTPPAKHWPKHLGNVSRFDFLQHEHPTSMEVG